MGAHKAYLLARSLEHIDVYLYADGVPAAVARSLMLKPVSCPQKTLDDLLAGCRGVARIGVFPEATTTYVRPSALAEAARR